MGAVNGREKVTTIFALAAFASAADAMLAPAYAAIECGRGGVDDELVWALVGVAANRARRRARRARIDDAITRRRAAAADRADA